MGPIVFYQSISFLSCYPDIDEESFNAAVYNAIREYPKETCGLVVTNGVFLMCENTSNSPNKRFKIDPYIVLRHRRENTLNGFFHSHAAESRFLYSPKDVIAQKTNQVPSYILRVTSDDLMSITVLGGQI